MSSNVGLVTPRGSGTSGYVQRNSAQLKPRDFHTPYNASGLRDDNDKIRQRMERKPDTAILEHNRQRAIEAKVFELRDQLEEEGEEDEEVLETKCEVLRKELLAKGLGKGDSRRVGTDGKRGKEDVHEMARRKAEESERFRKALGVREGYQDGDAWKRKDEVREERKRREMGEAGEDGVGKGESGGWEEKVRRRERDSQAQGRRGYDYD